MQLELPCSQSVPTCLHSSKGVCVQNVAVSDRSEPCGFWWQAVQQYGCRLRMISRTPRLESVGVEKKAIRPWIVRSKLRGYSEPGEGGGLRRSKRSRSGGDELID